MTSPRKKTSEWVRASAPGKVLITGGYLVLDPAYSGQVLAVNARFHCSITQLPSQQQQQQPQSQKYDALITVVSPQRAPLPSVYGVEINEAERWLALRDVSVADDNVFVHTALHHTLVYLYALCGGQVFRERTRDMCVHLVGDSQFYTAAAADDNKQTQQQQQPWETYHAPCTITPDGSKTGLGSSAALTSALVGALFAYFHHPHTNSSVSVTAAATAAGQQPSWLPLAHNIAQTVHCAAQGKVGSGFDISTAFYGSQRYTRFSPAIIKDLIALRPQMPIGDRVPDALQPQRWDNRVEPLRLPPGMVLLLGDVRGGSKTPGMVKKVLKWRADHPAEAQRLWDDLNANNERVGRLLATASAAVDVVALRETFLRVRELLREHSVKADVPIEPPAQTELLDFTMAQSGVVLSGVPGAGGFDAIFALAESNEAATNLQQQWLKHHGVTRLPLEEAECGLSITWYANAPSATVTTGPPSPRL